MSTSSMMPHHSLNSHESPSARPELPNESERLKLLLDMTNTLVSNLEFRDLLRAISASIRRDMQSVKVQIGHVHAGPIDTHLI